MIYKQSYIDCKPKNLKITILNEKKNIVNIYSFCNEEKLVEGKYEINNKGRYIKIDFLDNFGGNYIIIKQLTINVDCIHSVL